MSRRISMPLLFAFFSNEVNTCGGFVGGNHLLSKAPWRARLLHLPRIFLPLLLVFARAWGIPLLRNARIVYQTTTDRQRSR